MNTAKEVNNGANHFEEQASPLWVLCAHGSGARVFRSEGHLRNFEFIEAIFFPEERKKDPFLSSARGRSAQAEGTNYFLLHSLGNKSEASRYNFYAFAKLIVQKLEKAYCEQLFERLVLFAEPELLGLIKILLDENTSRAIYRAVPRNLMHMEHEEVKEVLKRELT